MHKSFHPSMAEPLPPSLWGLPAASAERWPRSHLPSPPVSAQGCWFCSGMRWGCSACGRDSVFSTCGNHTVMNRPLGCCTPAIQHWPEQIHTAQWSPTPVNLLWKSPGRSSSTEGEKLYCKFNFYSNFQILNFAFSNQQQLQWWMKNYFINDPALLTAQIKCKKSKYAK